MTSNWECVRVMEELDSSLTLGSRDHNFLPNPTTVFFYVNRILLDAWLDYVSQAPLQVF